jgi:hypothetical protein
MRARDGDSARHQLSMIAGTAASGVRQGGDGMR